MREWFANLFTAVRTVVEGMLVTLRVFGSTYDQRRRTFTEHFEYPELPAPVAARYRGFHRYDLTTLHRLRSVFEGVPGRLHLYRQGTDSRRQGLPRQRVHDRLLEVHVLRSLRGTLPRRLHLHGFHARPQLLQP